MLIRSRKAKEWDEPELVPPRNPRHFCEARTSAWRDDLRVVPFLVWIATSMLVATSSFAAATPPLFPDPMDASEIQLRLQKLNVLGRVLYLAAHPDDENDDPDFSLVANRDRSTDAGYLSGNARRRQDRIFSAC